MAVRQALLLRDQGQLQALRSCSSCAGQNDSVISQALHMLPMLVVWWLACGQGPGSFQPSAFQVVQLHSFPDTVPTAW